MQPPGPARTLVVVRPGWPAPVSGAEALEVAAGMERFSPLLVVLGPDRLALATRGPARRLGGEQALAAAVAQAVGAAPAPAGSRPGPVRVGVADGLFAAELAAARARGAEPVVVVPPGATAGYLEPMPVSVLGDADLAGVLVRLGIQTLGQLAALPVRSVAARFGPAGELAHLRSRGLDPGVAPSPAPTPTATAGLVLEPPAAQVEAAAFAARGVAEQLAGILASRGMAATLVGIELETEAGESLHRRWRIEGPTDLVAGLVQRVRWQLEGWLAGSDPPRGPLASLRITAEEVAPARGRQLGFWGGDQGAADRAAAALARIQARRGPAAVRRATLVSGTSRAGRSPADQVCFEVWGDPGEPAGHRGPAVPWPGRLPAPSPSVVHARRVAARVVDAWGAEVGVDGRARPTADPARISLAGGPSSEVRSWAGPWPLEERWWRRPSARRRARWQILTGDGAAHLVVLEGGRWWVEATYD